MKFDLIGTEKPDSNLASEYKNAKNARELVLNLLENVDTLTHRINEAHAPRLSCALKPEGILSPTLGGKILMINQMLEGGDSGYTLEDNIEQLIGYAQIFDTQLTEGGLINLNILLYRDPFTEKIIRTRFPIEVQVQPLELVLYLQNILHSGDTYPVIAAEV